LLSCHGNKEILPEAGAVTGETHGYFGRSAMSQAGNDRDQEMPPSLYRHTWRRVAQLYPSGDLPWRT
jgi:hypothetical protein